MIHFRLIPRLLNPIFIKPIQIQKSKWIRSYATIDLTQLHSLLMNLDEKQKLFEDSIQWGHSKELKLSLTDHCINPSENDNWAIRITSAKGYKDNLSILLRDQRIDPSAKDNMCIRLAAENGHADCVRLLLDHPNVDPSAKNNAALRWASRNGHSKCVSILLSDSRADPTADNHYAIKWAMANSHHACVGLLLADSRMQQYKFDLPSLQDFKAKSKFAFE
ncbi:hypothetical protein BC833DRAFT_620300 [Globomyces pollinis-pini]|nr:hypothetical protein BC833DRAFT_620300 [Globomyces pollinis-pini]KAJ2994914.1 hypothetical protein HDV02_001190 [Globomyces sp. JEL0801]KAJ2994922.1 hypothetical protein HDV02_001198 [Globomyces sp. JEL0801]